MKAHLQGGAAKQLRNDIKVARCTNYTPLQYRFEFVKQNEKDGHVKIINLQALPVYDPYTSMHEATSGALSLSQKILRCETHKPVQQLSRLLNL